MKKKDELNPPIVYAAKHTNENVVKNSSSGGMFSALSDYFIKNGNAVASCIYNYETDEVELVIYDNLFMRNKARGSKYIQANIDNGFKKIDDWLLNNPNKLLLVVGTGCQIACLDLFLKIKRKRERVVLVDLICHGATSPGLWKKYIKHEGISHKIEYLSFKDKRNGWHSPTVYARVNGKEKCINSFAEWFYGKWAIRESCYKCPYTKVKRYSTDITIGDYWGIENVFPDFSDARGVSLVILQTAKGEALFEKIKKTIYFRISNEQECLQPRLICPSERPKDRKQFWEDIQNKGIEYCAKKYKEVQNQNVKFLVKNKLKKVIIKFLKAISVRC